VAAAAQQAATDSTVLLKISAVPAEATILIDGAKVSNPYEGKFTKSDVNRTITVSATGYEEKTEMLALNKDIELSYELDKDRPTSGGRHSSAKKSDDSQPEVKAETKSGDAPAKKPRRKIDYDDPWN